MYDEWLFVGPLSFYFPRLFRVATNKGAWISECFSGEGGLVSWEVTFNRDLR